ncbi:hypothetical protein HRG_014077 [Hirsutella rhossiliensis]
MDRPLEQPDFAEAADGLRRAAVHLDRCRNLPAVDGGERLAQTLEAILHRLGALEQTVRRRFDEFDLKLDGFQRRMVVAEMNGMARLQNATAIRPEADLVPLLSVDTGQEIQEYPPTVGAVARLSVRDVDRLLRELGVPLAGTVVEKRRKLLLALGTTTRAV